MVPSDSVSVLPESAVIAVLSRPAIDCISTLEPPPFVVSETVRDSRLPSDMANAPVPIRDEADENPSKTRFCPAASFEISMLLEKFLAIVLSEISISRELPTC